MRKILVLRGGALGDFIVTLPALALLRARWPAAQITLAGNATAAELARARGLLDAVHSQHEARWAGLFGDAPLPAEFGAWLTDFDLVVSYWPDPEGEIRRRFPLRDGQTFLHADAMPQRAPAAAHYCEPLRTLGLEASEYSVALRVSAGTVPPLTRRATIAIHPGSGSLQKNWPIENWLALIERLRAPVTLILGEAEISAHSDRLRLRLLEDKRIHLLVTPPLETLVAHLANCRLFLGHDSGISHLAAACGARCVLLFGPTEPAMWAPPVPNVQVLQRGPELASLSIDEVEAAVVAALADQR